MKISCLVIFHWQLFISLATFFSETLLRPREEGDFFRQKFIDLENLIASTPVTYEQDGKGDDAIVYLHYFFGGCDWYITEKDADGGVLQAFGYAVLFGDKQNAELGYICITEITQFGAELDLYFTPCPLAEIKFIKIVA